jgi:hypothetical protein
MVRAAGAKVTKSGSAVDGWTTARSRRWFGYGLALALVVALNLACSGGASELDKALESVSRQDLAVMVLPQEAFGTPAEDLDVASGSGFQTSAAIASDSIDPEDTPDDIDEMGFVAAYHLMFIDPTGIVLEEGKGVFIASSTVELFSDREAARNRYSKWLEDQRRFSGQVLKGIRRDLLEEIEVDGIGDAATLARFHITSGDTDFYAPGTAFTIGPLFVRSGFVRVDEVDMGKEVRDLAVIHEARIEGILLGKIDEIPVPIPVEEDELQAAGAPSGPPFPEEMVLTLADLPDRAFIQQEGYVEDEDNQSEYVRGFDVSAVDIGNTRANQLSSNVSLYADEREAANLMSSVRAVYESDLGREVLQRVLTSRAQFKETVLSVAVVESSGVGETAFAIVYAYDAPVGEIQGMIYSFQVGRAIGRLNVESSFGEIVLGDIEELARIGAARMKSVLKVNP